MRQPAPDDKQAEVVVSRLAWDMAQWELHYLRGLVGMLIVEAMLHGRRARRLREAYREACMRALRDTEYRKRPAEGPSFIAVDAREQIEAPDVPLHPPKA